MARKELFSFTLDQRAAEIVDKLPKYRPKVFIGKSAHVSRAIIRYADDMNAETRMEKIASANVRIEELQEENAELRAQVRGRSLILAFLESLFRPFRARKREGPPEP